MAYQRKTTDEFEIQGNYGDGWECANTETTWKDARRSVREYRENDPSNAYKIVKKRVRRTVDHA